ncbi:MAG: hypothetical protein ABFD82_17925 [Syntrophaceae bacterium]
MFQSPHYHLMDDCYGCFGIRFGSGLKEAGSNICGGEDRDDLFTY